MSGKTFGVVTTARIKRMLDVQFISELCAVILKGSHRLALIKTRWTIMYAEYEDISELSGFVEDEFVENVEGLKKSIADMISLTIGCIRRNSSPRATSTHCGAISILERDGSSLLLTGSSSAMTNFMRAVRKAKDATQDATR